MIFRVKLLLLASFMLGGCSHLPLGKSSPTESPASDPGVVVQEPMEHDSTEVEANSSNDKEPQDHVGVSTAEITPVITPPIDLITRIREGFEFPDYSSKWVTQYERWNSEHPTFLTDLFARAEPFLFHIVEELDKRDMPLDIALLPAVESAFKPAARSRSAAAGLWQFVPATGRHFGLRQDWWYDGRLDVLLSTTAALDYLQELHAMFDNDWFLALAAYNAGQGTVRRAIARNKRKGRNAQYADLVLRSETVRYVPKLFALRNIITNPEKFGVVLPIIPNQPHFSAVSLPGQIDLQRFSKESGISISVLRHLNAAHKQWATSPQGPHRLLIPLSNLSQAQASIERLAKQPTIEYQSHQIRRGDSLSTISNRYGVSVAAIKQANNLKGTSIRAGKTLMIPISAVIGATHTGAALPSETEKGEQKIVHRVVAGDTLWSIAKRYQVRVAELLSWNRLSANQILSLDQSLLVFLK